MKPARFRYLAPRALEGVLEALGQHGDEARILAGEQSLVPAMALRLATPAVLVDVNRIPGPARVRVGGGELVVEMLARHSALERVAIDDGLGPLLARAARLVGHLPIRARGTFVGSIAHADPAAEWCMVARVLGATVVAVSARGERRIAARDFFGGPFTTPLAPDEVVTEVRVPLLRTAGAAVLERSATAGDFALVAAAAVVRVSHGRIEEARLCIGGAEGRPARAEDAEREAAGAPAAPAALDGLADALADRLEPFSDHRCSADYRRHLARVLGRRALGAALARAA